MVSYFYSVSFCNDTPHDRLPEMTKTKDTLHSGDLASEVRTLFERHKGELFKTNEISKMIGVRSDDERYQELRGILFKLEEQGTITRGSRRRFGIPLELPKKATGLLKIERNGHATVKPDHGSGVGSKIFIHKKDLHGAHSGDRVLVTLDLTSGAERPSGSIQGILESKVRNTPVNETSHHRSRKEDA